MWRLLHCPEDPASLYLQSENIGILTTVRLVETSQTQLFKLRGEFEKALNAA